MCRYFLHPAYIEYRFDILIRDIIEYKDRKEKIYSAKEKHRGTEKTRSRVAWITLWRHATKK